MITATEIGMNWNGSLPIFSSEAFLKSVSREYGWIGGTAEDGALVCALPFVIVHRAGLRLVRFTSETMFFKSDLSLDQEKQFLNSAVEHFRTAKADLIIPATFNSLFRTYPDQAIAAPYGTYVVDLTQSEESLWNNLHPKHRNVIRNALNKGVKLRFGTEHLSIAEGLVRDSFGRSTRGAWKRFFTLARMPHGSLTPQVLNLKDHVIVVLADLNGMVQGSAIIPFSDYCAYYSHGGTISHPVTGATNLLQWEAMKYFKGLGVKAYNFVGVRISPEPGSKQAGLTMFKQRFGGTLRRGYMWKYPLNPVKSRLYSLMAKMRSGGDVVDQERDRLGTV